MTALSLTDRKIGFKKKRRDDEMPETMKRRTEKSLHHITLSTTRSHDAMPAALLFWHMSFPHTIEPRQFVLLHSFGPSQGQSTFCLNPHPRSLPLPELDVRGKPTKVFGVDHEYMQISRVKVFAARSVPDALDCARVIAE